MASLVGEWLAVFLEHVRVWEEEYHCIPAGHQPATTSNSERI